ncbi:hypothetical protein GGX14DRAFT_577820 [Mycena pura]|uniref:Uncharacterized protein n=1 Tax=Mycena pura TaxID=153505 RepID=A0AAD6Y1Z1_9AGAR|nr:hypothetical protein GGX14DRAFT_577820 [Mycena pura]
MCKHVMQDPPSLPVACRPERPRCVQCPPSTTLPAAHRMAHAAHAHVARDLPCIMMLRPPSVISLHPTSTRTHLPLAHTSRKTRGIAHDTYTACRTLPARCPRPCNTCCHRTCIVSRAAHRSPPLNESHCPPHAHSLGCTVLMPATYLLLLALAALRTAASVAVHWNSSPLASHWLPAARRPLPHSPVCARITATATSGSIFP